MTLGSLYALVIALMIISDVVGLSLLKRHELKIFEELGCPKWYWTDRTKVLYLIGYVAAFRFFKIQKTNIKLILFVESICWWFLVLSFFYILWTERV